MILTVFFGALFFLFLWNEKVGNQKNLSSKTKFII